MIRPKEAAEDTQCGPDHYLVQALLGFAVKPSQSSLWQWRRRLMPYRMTGNTERSTLVGINQFHFCIFYFLYPDADMNEIVAFIHNQTGAIYTRSQISK
jgi:hypothetical protein